MFWVLAIYNPEHNCTCFAIAGAQLFGCSAAPLNFCRIPNWCSIVVARLLLIAFISCIDDMIFFERDNFADVAYRVWRSFAKACGWFIPDDKSPPPNFVFRALGAFVHLVSPTCAESLVAITEDRAGKMQKALSDILSDCKLTPSYSGQIFGQLGFACTQCHGKWGRAKLRPFIRRQYEVQQFALNPQLRAAIAWWQRNIPLAPKRRVFVNDGSRHVVVSYSDGEGSDAGVGIAIWCKSLLGERPWAGYLTVPPVVRELWALQRAHAERSAASHPDVEYNDIMEIEAVGPLLILHNWGSIMKNALWLHFIDNSCALGSLVKGSSSVTQQDRIVGATWSSIAQLNVLAWFDRVDSKSNPVDGLSRKDFRVRSRKLCNWVWKGITFPKQLRQELRQVVCDFKQSYAR